MVAFSVRMDFDPLYRQFGPLVFRRCRRLLSDDAQAADAMHDVFVALLRRRDITPNSPPAMLYKIATDVCLNRLRTRRRHPETTEAELLDSIVFDHDRRSSYGLSVGTALSWGPTPWLTLTLSPEWRLNSQSESDAILQGEPEIQFIHSEFTATVLLGERDLVQAGIINEVILLGLGADQRTSWGGSLLYAYAWEVFHLGFGVRYLMQPFSTPWGATQWLPVVDMGWRW